MTALEEPVRTARYAWGGDEFLFVEIDESMSLQAFQRVSALAGALESQRLDGITDICLTNASLLVRYDPEAIHPRDLLRHVQTLEKAVSSAERAAVSQTRILEFPVWYNDPVTAEVMNRFRSHHQAPHMSDPEYVADINGITAGARELIDRHHSTPWMVTAVGFVAGLPFMYQLAPRAEQLEAPKYLSPRTDTPALTVGHAGCFCCIYSVRGAGGYQMLGLAAAPIFAPQSSLADFRESMVLLRAGDIVKFKPVTQDEYDAIQRQCGDGSFRYRSATVEFNIDAWTRDTSSYNRSLMEALDGIAD